VDGRLVLLALVVVLAVAIAVDFGPVQPPQEVRAQEQRERTAAAVLVEVDCAQQRRFRFRGEYAAGVPSLQLWGAAEFARDARVAELDVDVRATLGGRGYAVRVAGIDVLALLERRDGRLTRLDTGDRPRPPVNRC
jgi:hypothetical protein